MLRKVNFDKLSDYQKILILKLSYVNLKKELIEKINSGEKICLSQLYEYLENKDSNYLGFIAQKVTGLKITPQEIIKELEKQGLGNIRIKKVKANEKTSFFALALEDEQLNSAIAFRGTEMNTLQNIVKDNLNNLSEFFKDNSVQADEAIEFFKENKTQSNYLFGHSLGGNLAQHVLLKNFNENIKEVFLINPYQVSISDFNLKILQKLNKKNILKCYIVGGDWVSEIRDWSNKIPLIFIKNNNKQKRNIFAQHTLEAIEYDNEGNFIRTARDKAIKNQEYHYQRKIIRFFTAIGNKIKVLFKRDKRKNLPAGNEEKGKTKDNDVRNKYRYQYHLEEGIVSSNNYSNKTTNKTRKEWFR